MPGSRHSTLSAFLQLCVVILITLAVPALVLRSSFAERFLRLKEPKPSKKLKALPASGGVRDAASGIALLRADKPRWVLVGNSMLNTRVEPGYLEQLSGHNVYKLSVSGTKSAMWYLLMKLIVADSGVKPGLVTVVFRDRDLTWPEQRMHQDESMVERMKGREQPEWSTVMGRYDAAIGIPWRRFISGREQDIQTLLPGTKLREWARGKLQKTGFDLSSFGAELEYPERKAELNDVLSMDHQRATRPKAAKGNEGGDGMKQKLLALEDVEPLDFDPSPGESFLPLMIELARKHGFRLHFHRIKINPVLGPRPGESGARLPGYLRDLEAYVKAQGCLYTDEHEVEAITKDQYVDDVHIKTDAPTQQAFMRHFWSQLQPVVDGVLKTPAAP